VFVDNPAAGLQVATKRNSYRTEATRLETAQRVRLTSPGSPREIDVPASPIAVRVPDVSNPISRKIGESTAMAYIRQLHARDQARLENGDEIGDDEELVVDYGEVRRGSPVEHSGEDGARVRAVSGIVDGWEGSEYYCDDTNFSEHEVVDWLALDFAKEKAGDMKERHEARKEKDTQAARATELRRQFLRRRDREDSETSPLSPILQSEPARDSEAHAHLCGLIRNCKERLLQVTDSGEDLEFEPMLNRF
jgi:hypothetical protein